MQAVLVFVGQLMGVFLVWTFIIYWIHRISHIKGRWNILWKIHRAHHAIPYLTMKVERWPKFGQFFFWLGDFKTSIDVVIVLTIPLVLLTLLFPYPGLCLLVFHYIYEVFLGEGILDHNTQLRGPVTRVFAWGSFHLHHHVKLERNYGLIITLWDRVFRTADDPDGSFIDRFRENRARRNLANSGS